MVPALIDNRRKDADFMARLHYSVHCHRQTALTRTERTAAFIECKRKLSAAGYKTETFFHFDSKDEKARDRARMEAEALAVKIIAESGVAVVVSEGMFL